MQQNDRGRRWQSTRKSQCSALKGSESTRGKAPRQSMTSVLSDKCPPTHLGRAGSDPLRVLARGRRRSCGLVAAVGETVILLHPPLPLVGVPIAMERERQQNDSLANG